jgi:transposase-like protein
VKREAKLDRLKILRGAIARRRQPPVAWRSNLENKIISMIRRGIGIRPIAKELRIPRGQVEKTIEKFGIHRAHKRGRPIREKQNTA